ncbi:MAG TPA: DUF6510 family protein [Gemmatimonadales bacterium]|nr:DUF6510 family protein [Gemmatimonadales bacterium]
MDAGIGAADERLVAGESVADALRLDGNAAAGILSELFVPDVTTARATCDGCGSTRPIGALAVYAHGMGTVVRCPGCNAVVLCVTRTATRVWLDSRGTRRIVMPIGDSRA